jgi:hypothetical protein
VELAGRGVVSGFRDAHGDPTGLFKPAAHVTIAEMLKMSLLSAGKTLTPAAPRNRSARGDWSAPYVATAETLRLSLFTSPALRVQADATRGQVIQTLLESFSLPLRKATPGLYRDLPISSRYADAIATATALGILSGDTDAAGKPTGTVRPNDPINRAEVAKIVTLTRNLKK